MNATKKESIEDRLWRAAQALRERDAWKLVDAYVERKWRDGSVAAVTFAFQNKPSERAVVFSLRGPTVGRVHTALGSRYRREEPREEAPFLIRALRPPKSAREIVDELDAIASAVDGRGDDVVGEVKSKRADILWPLLDALHANARWPVRSFGFAATSGGVSTTFSLMADAGAGAAGTSAFVSAKRGKAADQMRTTLVVHGFDDKTSEADPVVWLQHARTDIDDDGVIAEAELLESVLRRTR